MLSKISSEARDPYQHDRFPIHPAQRLIQLTIRQDVAAIGSPRFARDYRKSSPARNRRHQRYLISLFELVVFTQEANVFIIDINIQEAANIALFIAQVRLEIGKAAAERVQQSGRSAPSHS